MALVLKDRDYALGAQGELLAAQGAQALLGEVLFRLTARQGSFPFLPRLGSRLHQLRWEKPGQWQMLALQYAAEALEGLEAEVTGVQVDRTGDRLDVRVFLQWKGLPLEVEWEGEAK